VPARNEGTQELVFRALTGHSNDYRPMVKPADMIEQSKKRPTTLTDLFRKLLPPKSKRYAR
jgi:hypothetical protein